MENIILLVYIVPIVVAFLWRLEWWIFHSQKNAALVPDTTDSDVDITLLTLVFWPVALLGVVVLLLVIAICSPFWALVRALRNSRLNMTR